MCGTKCKGREAGWLYSAGLMRVLLRACIAAEKHLMTNAVGESLERIESSIINEHRSYTDIAAGVQGHW